MYSILDISNVDFSDKLVLTISRHRLSQVVLGRKNRSTLRLNNFREDEKCFLEDNSNCVKIVLTCMASVVPLA